MRHYTETVSGLLLLACLVLLSGCDQENDGNPLHKVNGSVHVLAGGTPSGAETVNGNIDIDADATVMGATTVNGGIRLGAHATAASLTTVNGGIEVGAGAHVAKTAESVNGGVSLADGAEVLGSVVNVNGKIELAAAHVGGGIKTVNGDILIYGASSVEGGIHVEKSGGFFQFQTHTPRIEIGPGATVRGELKFDREVKLYVSDKATVGSVVGATAMSFTTDTAPRN